MVYRHRSNGIEDTTCTFHITRCDLMYITEISQETKILVLQTITFFSFLYTILKQQSHGLSLFFDQHLKLSVSCHAPKYQNEENGGGTPS